eukprot:Em0110g7a
MCSVSTAEVTPLLAAEKSKRPTDVGEFNVRYQCFRYRGPALLLVWNFTILFIVVFMEAALYDRVKVFVGPMVTTVLLYRFNYICFFLYPLAGLAADLLCGRYTAIMLSVAISIGFLFVGAVMSLMIEYHLLLNAGIMIALAVVILAVHSFFQANALQFGADNLQDASSEELRSFVYWFVWVYALAQLPIVAVFQNQYIMIGSEWRDIEYAFLAFATAVLLGGALLLLVCHFTCFKLSAWFIREPPSRNPYITACRILLYTKKNSVPVNRSSLTYWEDDMPPRMDVAKTKYGGPFSDEEVEDVKTLIGVSMVLLSLGTFGYMQVVAIPHWAFIRHVGVDTGFKLVSTFLASPVFLSVFVIPIQELLNRLFSRRLSMLTKLRVAVVIYVISTGINLLVDAVGHYLAHNLQCMFTAETAEGLLSSVHPFILFVPALLSSVATVTIDVTSMEFIIAQSPYSMRGMLIGLFFFSQGVFGIIASLSILPFDFGDAELGLSCCSLYYIINFALVFLMSAIFWLVARKYRLRRRTEVINEYQMVEEHYSRRVDQIRSHEGSMH